VVLWDWINNLLKELGIPPITKSISQKSAVRVGKVLEGVYNLFRIKSEPRMTHFLAMALSCSHYYDLTNAKRDFRYAPPVNPDEALRRTIEYFKNAPPSSV
jgi:2-alkyl-3-oxoalkanoate reductase